MEDREEGNCVYYETRSRLRVISGQPSVILTRGNEESRSRDRFFSNQRRNKFSCFAFLRIEFSNFPCMYLVLGKKFYYFFLTLRFHVSNITSINFEWNSKRSINIYYCEARAARSKMGITRLGLLAKYGLWWFRFCQFEFGNRGLKQE